MQVGFGGNILMDCFAEKPPQQKVFVVPKDLELGNVVVCTLWHPLEGEGTENGLKSSSDDG